MAYHYTDSGLDYIYLENGYTVHETPYGRGVSIENLDGLHQAIGRHIVDNPSSISGPELRFLRLELDLTQRDLGGILGQQEQAICRWEKPNSKAINGSADLLLRALYLEYISGKSDIRRMVDRLAKLDQKERTQVYLCETPDGWQDYGCLETA